MTGLPQVTVPAGFLGDRYPFGVSLLGRQWADRRLLATRIRLRAGDAPSPPAARSAIGRPEGRPLHAFHGGGR